MAKDKLYGKTLRKNFARHEEIMPMPNLLEIQKTSYKWFLETGLREVFADVGSISDYAGTLELSAKGVSVATRVSQTRSSAGAPLAVNHLQRESVRQSGR